MFLDPTFLNEDDINSSYSNQQVVLNDNSMITLKKENMRRSEIKKPIEEDNNGIDIQQKQYTEQKQNQRLNKYEQQNKLFMQGSNQQVKTNDNYTKKFGNTYDNNEYNIDKIIEEDNNKQFQPGGQNYPTESNVPQLRQLEIKPLEMPLENLTEIPATQTQTIIMRQRQDYEERKDKTQEIKYEELKSEEEGGDIINFAEDEKNLQNIQNQEDQNMEPYLPPDEIQQLQSSEQNQENPDQTPYVDAQINYNSVSSLAPKRLPYPKALDPINIVDMKMFLISPAQKGGMIQCTIKRDKSGMGRFYPKYHMHLSNGYRYLMSAKKMEFNNTSNYAIGMNKSELDKKNSNYLGKVRSNFMGTEFVFYDHGQNPKKAKSTDQVRKELGAGFYESNLMGQKGPRKMTIILPKIDEETGLPEDIRPRTNKEGIINEHMYSLQNKVTVYSNRQPKWNEVVQAFVLNFYGRVDKPSVKNFQLIQQNMEDNIYLQFGRIGEDIFNLDFQWPVSPLQAFQIALSSFDYKLACE